MPTAWSCPSAARWGVRPRPGGPAPVPPPASRWPARSTWPVRWAPTRTRGCRRWAWPVTATSTSTSTTALPIPWPWSWAPRARGCPGWSGSAATSSSASPSTATPSRSTSASPQASPSTPRRPPAADPVLPSQQRAPEDVDRVEVPLMGLRCPVQRPRRVVVREAGVPVRDLGPHPVIAPVVVLPHRLDEPVAILASQAVAVHEQPEAIEDPGAPAVVDAALRAQRRPQACGARDVPEPAPGAGQVEVDERDSPPSVEDDVVEVDVVVTDQLAGERIWRGRRPRMRTPVEGLDGAVVATEQVGDADQRLVGERPMRERRRDGGTGNVGEHLAALLVHAEKAGRGVEPHLGEVTQQGMGRRARGALWPPDRLADPDDLAAVGGAAHQDDLGFGLLEHRLLRFLRLHPPECISRRHVTCRRASAPRAPCG